MANESATTATDEQADMFQRFMNFLKSYRTESGSLKYREMIQRLPVTGERSVVIDYNELLDFDPQLARQIIDESEDFFKAASEAVKAIVELEDRDYSTKIIESGHEFKARLRNVTTGKIKLRMIRANHIGKLIMVDGIITRVSEVKPQLLVATFECTCGEKTFVEQFEGRFTPPAACKACKREGPFNLIVEESKFIDWQKIRIQEMPEELPPGQMPRSLDAIIKDDLVDIARPGDRVAIIGTLMSVQDFAPKRGRLTTFRTYIDSNYVDTMDRESEKVEITPEEEKTITQLSKDEWIHQKIIKSIAPSIYGLEDVKEAIALTLFGGVPKTLPDGVKIRGEINVLLVGDPGTAKSQILLYTAGLAPRGLYTSGKGSSAAGLTAAVLRDTDTGDMTLEAGALVLADRGVACLHPDMKIVFDDRVVSVVSLFNPDLKVQATSGGESVQISPTKGTVKSFDLDGLHSADDECTLVRRKMYSGLLVKAKLASGSELMLTPNHRLVDGSSLQWKEIGSFSIGESVLAPTRRIPSTQDYFLDKIISIDHEHYDGWVYDLRTKHHHSFVGNGVLLHNCVDEFDKMNPQDRVAIHQAMEQQSSHGSVEVALANGLRVPIGGLVDSLFLASPGDVVKGVNCEILDVRSRGMEIFASDFHDVQPARVDRVSRHPAPDHFHRITFSNGREVVVTPEHPMFLYDGCRLYTVPAEEIKVGDFAPAFRLMPCGHNPGAVLVVPSQVHFNAKPVLLPERMTPQVARLLGYFITEGFTNFRSSAELGFSNTSPDIRDNIAALMEQIFGLESPDYNEKDRTIRYISAQVRDFLWSNFPEIIGLSRDKRLPPQLFTSGRKVVLNFLQAAFLGDGSVETDSACYRTGSKGLAWDYQDLLLCVGIQSRIAHDIHNDSYKVYICGASLPLFYNIIVESWDPRRERVAGLASRSEATNRNHDVFPPGFGVRVKRLCEEFGLPQRGVFSQAEENGYGITRMVLKSFLDDVRREFLKAKKALDVPPEDVKSARSILRWSPETSARKIGVAPSCICDSERNGYTQEYRKKLVSAILESVRSSLAAIELEIDAIDAMLQGDVCMVRVRRNEEVRNAGKWSSAYVYDVTVEPHHCFISHGVLLHNTISIAKAGIVATLNARTAILAAANPALGRYNSFKNPAENINLPVTVLSRFDLIFVMVDKPESERDRKMAEHVISLHSSRPTGNEAPISPLLLRKYISYAKRLPPPVLTDEAAVKIREFYLETRAMGENPESPVPITARQLEALVRLAESRAKMALKKEITVDDAEAVIRLMTTSLKMVGIDRETMRADIDTIMVGRTKSQRERVDLIITLVKELGEGSKEGFVQIEKIVEAAGAQGVERQFALDTINRLIKEGVLFEPRQGIVKKA